MFQGTNVTYDVDLGDGTTATLSPDTVVPAELSNERQWNGMKSHVCEELSEIVPSLKPNKIRR